MKKSVSYPRTVALAAALVLLAAAVGGFGMVVAASASGSFDPSVAAATLFSDGSPSALLRAVGYAAEASVVEELVFRGALLGVLVARWGRGRGTRAVVVSAVVFGVLHLLPGGDGLAGVGGAPSLATGELPGAAPAAGGGALLVVQAAAKAVQGTLFGLVMGFLTLQSPWFSRTGWQRVRCLEAPLALHFGFDLLYTGVPLLSGVPLPVTYMTGSAADLLVVVATLPLLAAALGATLRFSWRGEASGRASGGSC